MPDTTQMSIGELADAAGLSRRSIRFYVQRGLIPPPAGRGRGSYYETAHLERLRQVLELQAAGHSLEAIGRILEGEDVPAPSSSAAGMPRPRPRSGVRARVRSKPSMTASLWTRVQLAEGIELSFDATRHQPEAEDLLAVKQAILAVFQKRNKR